MNAPLIQRQAALAGVALLAATGALALARGAQERSLQGPAAASAGAVEWQEARAGPYGPGSYGTKTTCNVELTPKTRGVAHPVLPCGVDLIVSYGGRSVRADVVDRGPHAAGREFDLTQALADDLGLRETQPILWRFAP
jgi:rare lipoprotein A (peptidoglycan hydrolase)